MSILLHELTEKLIREDEVTLLELLEINSEMITERFSDIIEEKQDYLERAISEE